MGKRIRKSTGGIFDSVKNIFRVEMEESFYAERGHGKNINPDPWLEIVPGSRGHLYVHALEPPTLGVASDTGGIAARLRRDSNLTVTQDGNSELNGICPATPDNIRRYAEILKCRRVRQMTPEQLEELRSRAVQMHAATTAKGRSSDG